MSSSRENEFGDKNNLETRPNLALKFFLATGPPLPVRYHVCLLKHAKSEKSNDSNLYN